MTLSVNRWDGKEVFCFGFLCVAALDGVCVVASLLSVKVSMIFWEQMELTYQPVWCFFVAWTRVSMALVLYCFLSSEAFSSSYAYNFLPPIVLELAGLIDVDGELGRRPYYKRCLIASFF